MNGSGAVKESTKKEHMFNFLKKLFSAESKSGSSALKGGTFTPLSAKTNKQAVRRGSESRTSDSWMHPVIYTTNSAGDSGRPCAGGGSLRSDGDSGGGCDSGGSDGGSDGGGGCGGGD